MIMWLIKKVIKLKPVLIGCCINTALIYSETLEINAVQGTIGGNLITDAGIVGDKFSITNGVIKAEDAVISGTFKTALTGQRVVLDSASNSFKFYDDTEVRVEITTGIINPIGGIDPGIIVGGPGIKTLVLPGGVIMDDGTDTVIISQSGTSIKNSAGIYVGFTGTKTAGDTIQFVNGFCVG